MKTEKQEEGKKSDVIVLTNIATDGSAITPPIPCFIRRPQLTQHQIFSPLVVSYARKSKKRKQARNPKVPTAFPRIRKKRFDSKLSYEQNKCWTVATPVRTAKKNKEVIPREGIKRNVVEWTKRFRRGITGNVKYDTVQKARKEEKNTLKVSATCANSVQKKQKFSYVYNYWKREMACKIVIISDEDKRKYEVSRNETRQQLFLKDLITVVQTKKGD